MKERTGQGIEFMIPGRLIEWYRFLLCYKQASVADAASRTAETSGLTQSLERGKEELGQLRMQLRDKQGMHKSCSCLLRMNFQYDKISFMICARDDDRSRGS